MIGAQVDFTQLNRLGDKVKDNVIPFKPRDKKSKGGLMSLLKTLGMRAPDKIADKKQIENVIRDPKTDLERILKDNPSTGTKACLLYTSPSPRDGLLSRMPSSA